jgi:alkylation response protein AidB-like acyl-CoA dehydrogenase
MDVRFSPEQQSLRDTAAQLVERLAPRTVAELGDTERAAKLDATVDAAGWRELRTVAPGGGPWASAVEVAIVAEELGRGLADTPFLGPTLAVELRRLAETDLAPSRETVALEAGLATIARADAGRVAAPAVAIDAAGAESALVLVPSAVGSALGTVPVAGSTPAVDLTRLAAGIQPDTTVNEPVSELTGSLTSEHLDRWTAFGLAVTSADLVGTMSGALRLACDYAGSREQYGVPIGSFQSVQHLLADAHVALEGSRSAALHAAWAVDALPADDALAAAAVAKAYASRAARAVCETAIQVHGGIGNTWDCLAHVFLRRALLSIDVLGGEGPCVDRVLRHRGIGGDDGLR